MFLLCTLWALFHHTCVIPIHGEGQKTNTFHATYKFVMNFHQPHKGNHCHRSLMVNTSPSVHILATTLHTSMHSANMTLKCSSMWGKLFYMNKIFYTFFLQMPWTSLQEHILAQHIGITLLFVSAKLHLTQAALASFPAPAFHAIVYTSNLWVDGGVKGKVMTGTWKHYGYCMVRCSYWCAQVLRRPKIAVHDLLTMLGVWRCPCTCVTVCAVLLC